MKVARSASGPGSLALALLTLLTLETTAGLPWTTGWTAHDDWLGIFALNKDEIGLDALIDPPRLPGPPAEAVSEGGGWLSRWLSVGGEGSLTVFITNDTNVTLPHRPAAFPSQLFAPLALPVSGLLLPFSSFLNSSDPKGNSRSPSNPVDFVADATSGAQTTGTSAGSYGHSPEYGCIPPSLPPRYSIPPAPWKIALLERGQCDFASKVRAAQERGAAGVVVGDGKLRESETDEEGRKRESLITMFSPEDTEAIFIPSVFVSRASYLLLRDFLANGTVSEGYPGLWVEVGEGSDEGATLGSLLSFALLMPTLFLLTTVAAHRIRIARQREADRAPPLLVLSLPERIWSPDIVWEKDSDSETASIASSRSKRPSRQSSPRPASPTSAAPTTIPPPPPISPSEVTTPPAVQLDDQPCASGPSRKKRSKSGMSHGKKYFSKDECAICMDSFQRGEVVRILPCGHVFHKDECDEWLLKWRKLCPTCRADVTLPPGEVVQGTTITPVAPPVGEDVVQPTWSARVFGKLQSGWNRVLGRGLRLEDGPGERTPLVETAPLLPATRDEV